MIRQLIVRVGTPLVLMSAYPFSWVIEFELLPQKFDGISEECGPIFFILEAKSPAGCRAVTNWSMGTLQNPSITETFILLGQNICSVIFGLP